MADHGAQALQRGREGFFGQQRIGLADGGQRIANFVRQRGRHAPHGGEFFIAHPVFDVALVLHENHAGGLDRAVWLKLAQARAQMHLLRLTAGAGQVQGLARVLPLLQQRTRPAREQRPGWQGGQARIRRLLARSAQHGAGGRVGVPDLAVCIEHQHALAQARDNELVDLRLRIGSGAVRAGLGLLAPEPLRQLVHQQRDQKQPHPGDRPLHVGGGELGLAQLAGQGVEQQQQGGAGGSAQRQPQRPQHRSQQHRQHKQRLVIESADLHKLQQPKQRQIEPQREHPSGGPKRFGARRAAPAQHRQRGSKIGQAEQPQPQRGAAL